MIFAENEVNKPELGFWVGASNPFPGSQTASVVNTTLGFGMFMRFNWPFNIFLTELGGSYSNYLSSSERGLTVMPLYAALAYKLPFDLPVSFFIKAGGGAAYVIARPANVQGWDPLGYAGVEISFVAGRKVRIGLRLDYNQIFETQKSKPPETQYLYSSPNSDSRISNPNYYNLVNGQFFHFGLMVSLFL
ncbi:MAG: hypothetical protein K8R21_03045 [Leptospira sp.]|nr:hypothetical protein [Leptospira sp.]